MKKKIIIGLILSLSFLFLFCSCEKKYEKTNTSILTSFKIEGVEEAGKVIITAREKESGKKIEVRITPGKEKKIEVEPGTYLISSVKTDSKRVSVSIKEQYFSVSKSHKYMTFTVNEENVKNTAEWFLYNNSLYLAGIIGSMIFLGIVKYKKEKRLGMR